MSAEAITRDGLRRITIMQGETRVSDQPDVILTTVLGSCIAACLYDPAVKVGGINHFLLAEPGSASTDAESMKRYGVYAMEVLINAMLAKGAARGRLRARIYGGASRHDGVRDLGSANADFARRFLRQEGIALVGEDVGGREARRVEFRPTVGLARCRVAAGGRPDAQPVRLARPAPPPPAPPGGDVEFF